MSKVGEVRIDHDPNTNRTQEGDMFNLDFAPRSFDTVICDPPFKYYNRFKWILNLAQIADKRLLISAPNINIYLPKRNWKRSLWYEITNTLFLRTYWCFDRTNHSLVSMRDKENEV
jgi:hypothetical protein